MVEVYYCAQCIMGNMIKMVNWNTVELKLKHSIHSNEHAMSSTLVSQGGAQDWFTGLFCVLLVSQWMVHCHSSNVSQYIHTIQTSDWKSYSSFIQEGNVQMQGLYTSFQQFGKLQQTTYNGFKGLTLHKHTSLHTQAHTHTRACAHTLQHQSLSSRMFLVARSRWMKPFFER